MRAPLLKLVTLLALAAGCSSSPSTTPSGPNADSYAGTWTFQSGSIVPNCPSGLNVSTIDLTGQPMTVTKVDSTHVAIMIAATDVMCDVNFTVDGSTATAGPGQSCAIKANGQSATVNISSWTLTLSSDGMQLGTSMMGTATVLIVTCNPTSTGTLTKSSTDAG
jgi:hypothetical protein